jgi:hypothetical protein
MYMISRYVCLYIEQNIRHKSESLYDRILYFNNNIYCALKFQEKYVTLNITTPKTFEPSIYAGYLFVFQIFFCTWETKIIPAGCYNLT